MADKLATNKAVQAQSCTQIIYLTIPKGTDLRSSNLGTSSTWSEALNLLQSASGFQRMYWGRSPEDSSRVQLHIVRDSLSQHRDFLASPSYGEIVKLFQSIDKTNQHPLVRHAYITEQTANCQALGKGAPFTGTAIYVGCDAAWFEGAWPLWTHIVRYVRGCIGIAGGRVVENVDGYENCYIVYVGWESIEAHEDYHHTKHFAQRRIILGLGNKGYREYQHISFDGSKEKEQSKL